MATPVLTAADQFQCGHGFPIAVIVPPNRSLTAGGNPVVVQQDILLGVPSCTVTAPPGPCKTVTSVIAGVSQVLQVDGAPVLLAGASGLTNAGTWSALTPGSPALEA